MSMRETFIFIANKDVCDFSHAMYIVLFILNKMHFDLQLQCKCLCLIEQQCSSETC